MSMSTDYVYCMLDNRPESPRYYVGPTDKGFEDESLDSHMVSGLRSKDVQIVRLPKLLSTSIALKRQ